MTTDSDKHRREILHLVKMNVASQPNAIEIPVPSLISRVPSSLSRTSIEISPLHNICKSLLLPVTFCVILIQAEIFIFSWVVSTSYGPLTHPLA
jgi:hypothetical protein